MIGIAPIAVGLTCMKRLKKMAGYRIVAAKVN